MLQNAKLMRTQCEHNANKVLRNFRLGIVSIVTLYRISEDEKGEIIKVDRTDSIVDLIHQGNCANSVKKIRTY